MDVLPPFAGGQPRPNRAVQYAVAMPWFSKRSKPALLPASSFWEWWNGEGAGLVEAAIDAGDFGGLPAVITAKLDAVHPDLAWELGPGTQSQHSLTVSAGGSAEARPAAERWLRSAPAPSAVWEYCGSRQRASDVSSLRLRYDGIDVAFSEALLATDLDADRARIDTTVFHPAFSTLAPQHHLQVAFLLLDAILGEDDVERWIGTIDVAIDRPATGIPPAELAEAVDALAARSTGEWALIQVPGPQLHLARVMRPLHRVDFPLFDRHSAVQVVFSTTSEHGGPDDTAFAELSALEDELIEVLGAAGSLVLVETTPRRRTFHIYSDGEDQHVEDAVTRWAARSRQTTVVHSLDPAWGKIRDYL